MEKPKQSKSFNPRFLFWAIVAIVITVYLGTFVAFYRSNKIHFFGTVDKDLFGQYGDFIGGVAGTIINFGGIIFLFINYGEQKKLNDLQFEVITEQKELNKKQLQAAEREHSRYIDEILPQIRITHTNSIRLNGEITFNLIRNNIYELRLHNPFPEEVKYVEFDDVPVNLLEGQIFVFYYEIYGEEVRKKFPDLDDYAMTFILKFKDRVGTKYKQSFNIPFKKNLDVIALIPELDDSDDLSPLS